MKADIGEDSILEGQVEGVTSQEVGKQDSVNLFKNLTGQIKFTKAVQMMECCLRVAPRAEKKIMQAPWPPTTPTMNIRVVATKEPKFPISRRAARRCAIVIKMPPIRMVFLGPYLLNRWLGTTPTKVAALTANLNYTEIRLSA